MQFQEDGDELVLENQLIDSREVRQVRVAHGGRMRLQQTLGLLLATSAAATEVAVSSKVQLYADTDRTVVVSPHVTGTVTLDTRTSLSATYTEDVVNAGYLGLTFER